MILLSDIGLVLARQQALIGAAGRVAKPPETEKRAKRAPDWPG